MADAAASAPARPGLSTFLLPVPDAIISVRGLTKIYPTAQPRRGLDFPRTPRGRNARKPKPSAEEFTALHHISVDFPRGKFTAVMGPSGSGKSSLLKCLVGLDSFQSGIVKVAGKNLGSLTGAELASFRRSQVGLIFQSFNLVPTLNVVENIEISADLQRVPVNRSRFKTLVSRLGLAKCLRAFPAELSSGQQLKVACARALLTSPAVVVADEPTGNLDSESSAEILGFLREISREWGQSVIVATHELEVAGYADNVLFFRNGTIVAQLVEPTENTLFEAWRTVGTAGFQAVSAAWRDSPEAPGSLTAETADALDASRETSENTSEPVTRQELAEKDPAASETPGKPRRGITGRGRKKRRPVTRSQKARIFASRSTVAETGLAAETRSAGSAGSEPGNELAESLAAGHFKWPSLSASSSTLGEVESVLGSPLNNQGTEPGGMPWEAIDPALHAVTGKEPSRSGSSQTALSGVETGAKTGAKTEQTPPEDANATVVTAGANQATVRPENLNDTKGSDTAVSPVAKSIVTDKTPGDTIPGDSMPGDNTAGASATSARLQTDKKAAAATGLNPPGLNTATTLPRVIPPNPVTIRRATGKTPGKIGLQPFTPKNTEADLATAETRLDNPAALTSTILLNQVTNPESGFIPDTVAPGSPDTARPASTTGSLTRYGTPGAKSLRHRDTLEPHPTDSRSPESPGSRGRGFSALPGSAGLPGAPRPANLAQRADTPQPTPGKTTSVSSAPTASMSGTEIPQWARQVSLPPAETNRDQPEITPMRHVSFAADEMAADDTVTLPSPPRRAQTDSRQRAASRRESARSNPTYATDTTDATGAIPLPTPAEFSETDTAGQKTLTTPPTRSNPPATADSWPEGRETPETGHSQRRRRRPAVDPHEAELAGQNELLAMIAQAEKLLADSGAAISDAQDTLAQSLSSSGARVKPAENPKNRTSAESLEKTGKQPGSRFATPTNPVGTTVGNPVGTTVGNPGSARTPEFPSRPQTLTAPALAMSNNPAAPTTPRETTREQDLLIARADAMLAQAEASSAELQRSLQNLKNPALSPPEGR